jgi:hypothetical protein
VLDIFFLSLSVGFVVATFGLLTLADRLSGGSQ